MPINLRRPKKKNLDEKWGTCCWCDSDGDYRPWPESMLIERDGKTYCIGHYRFCFNYADMADEPIDIPTEDNS